VAHERCPWWLGWALANPLRKLFQNPADILRWHVAEGMVVLEPGPGMGFFTLQLARFCGPSGKVIAVDIEPKMLEVLARRAQRAGVGDRIETRQAQLESLGVQDLAGTVDLVLAFAMVHELPNPARFYSEAAEALKPGGRLLLAEPRGHVRAAEFDKSLRSAEGAGLRLVDTPRIPWSHAAVLEKP